MANFQQYNISGMSCAACVTRVENAVKKISGVSECYVNLLTNSMKVSGTADSDQIIQAVTDAGYGAHLACQKNSPEKNTDENQIKDIESPALLKRLILSLFFLLVLMYFSMGHIMLNFPLPHYFSSNMMAVALVQLFLCIIIMLINKNFFISGTKSILHGSPNMDSLVSLGSGVSFLWSIICLFKMSSFSISGNINGLNNSMHSLYFESSAMILTLITAGKFLEARAKGKTTNALNGLLNLTPRTTTLIRDGQEITVSIEEIKPGDCFITRPGETISVDGIVLEGISSVDESALTGESIPAEKKADSKVFAGTINQSGFLKCQATAFCQETVLSQIIQMVKDANCSKAPIAKIADKVSGVFVPAVLFIAIITFTAWMILGAGVEFSLARGISVLLISCPCALGLATPVAIMVATGKGAKTGILFKTAESLEVCGKAKIVVLDKTGTITKGQPSVTDVIPAPGITKDELIQAALNVEENSEHIFSNAIKDYGKNYGFKPQPVMGFKAIAGKGVCGICEGSTICGGNRDFILGQISHTSSSSNQGFPPQQDAGFFDNLARSGKTPLYFSKDEKFLGAICVADIIKTDSASAVAALKKKGFKVIMLTGDNELTANFIGQHAGVDQIIAGVLPQEKANVIKNLQANGKNTVIMIGDGINDAPALTTADCGIAMGKGTDIAIDAADIVLVNGTLTDALNAINLSKKTLTNIKQNLFWAFIYNIIGIPLAAGCFIHAFGWELNPMFGAAAMSLSSFCVVTNALRLNFVKMNSGKTGKDDKHRNSSNIIEGNAMTKTLKIEGMMCPHCEAHVKSALEKIEGITCAVTSHEKGTAVVELSAEIPEDTFRAVIEEAGYKYLGQE